MVEKRLINNPHTTIHCHAVIDADGLWVVAHDPGVVKNFPEGCPVVLTPNLIEFARLQVGVRERERD